MRLLEAIKIFFLSFQLKLCSKNSYFLSPSTPIMPSPSESPALRNVLVSASVRALAPAEKFCRNSLERRQSHRNIEYHRKRPVNISPVRSQCFFQNELIGFKSFVEVVFQKISFSLYLALDNLGFLIKGLLIWPVASSRLFSPPLMRHQRRQLA